ncbi:MAG: C-GCAxxG-C-C family protein [Coriobacteriia bacterium]|nr:C-GCAxxG-C-C family protein [Coriobacteriia bacterium]
MENTEYQRRMELARQFHHKGYNCAQSVVCATCDLVGLDVEQAFRVMEGFGGGMGGFTQVCGALSGGVATISYGNSEGSQALCSKASTYERVNALVEAFKEAHGGCTLCSQLRPEDPDQRMPVCNGYITNVVRMTLDALAQRAKEDVL